MAYAPTRMKAHRILCLAALLALPSCNKPQEDLSALQSTVDELRAALETTRKQTAQIRAEIQKLSEQRDKADALIADLAKGVLASESQVLELTTTFMHYRNEYRQSIRQRAAGMKLADFEAAGRSYRGIEVNGVDDWELSFKHSNGVSRIDLKDAPPEIRILFAYNPNIGPKPEKAIGGTAAGALAAAGSAGAGMAGAGGAAGSDTRYAYAASAGPASNPVASDPFSTSLPGTVASEMGYTSSTSRRKVSYIRGGSGANVVRLPDGSMVEVIASW